MTRALKDIYENDMDAVNKDYETYNRGEEKQFYYKSIWDLFQSSY